MGLEYPCVYYKPGGLCEKYSTDGITSYCVQGPCPDQSLSNSDRIRAMGDEELATMLNRFAEGEDAPHYCRNLPECNTDMEADNLIPLERCQACLLHWLQRPAEGDVSDARIS